MIKKVTIKMGSKEVELTLEQAKKLHEDLDQLFGKKVEKEYYPHYPYYPYRRRRDYDWTRTIWDGATSTSSGTTDTMNYTITI